MHMLSKGFGGPNGQGLRASLEQDKELLQEPPVFHFWGDQERLVTVCLFHDAFHVHRGEQLLNLEVYSLRLDI